MERTVGDNRSHDPGSSLSNVERKAVILVATTNIQIGPLRGGWSPVGSRIRDKRGAGHSGVQAGQVTTCVIILLTGAL